MPWMIHTACHILNGWILTEIHGKTSGPFFTWRKLTRTARLPVRYSLKGFERNVWFFFWILKDLLHVERISLSIALSVLSRVTYSDSGTSLLYVYVHPPLCPFVSAALPASLSLSCRVSHEAVEVGILIYCCRGNTDRLLNGAGCTDSH